MADQPWDLVKKTPETLALEEKTARLRREGLKEKPKPPAKKAGEVGEIGATDAWTPAEKAERRQNRIRLLTKPWGDAANKK